jgi:hypothetical protein
MGGAEYALNQFSSQPNSLVAAIANLPKSRPAAALVQQRQRIILMAVATKSFKVVGSRVASAPQSSSSGSGGGGGIVYGPPPSAGTVQAIAYRLLPSFGFNAASQFSCLNNIWTKESNWNPYAANASGAYGIPQALPGSKMASAGPNWQTNPTTQIKWGLGYIKGRYGTPCAAWSFWQGNGWY